MRFRSFSKYHPAVNFTFFAAAICLGAVFRHPAYIAAGVASSALYYALLNGRKSVKYFIVLILAASVITGINPFFNTRGNTVLFRPFGRPYTLEALIYGGAIASVFVITMLWFGCYNKVITGDKFTCLFGNIAPSVSLLLVAVLRLVPQLIKKAGQITSARRCIGKGAPGFTGRLAFGASSLGALASYALEGGVVTGDSMIARGYGTAKRTSFTLWSFKASGAVLIALIALLSGTVIAFAALGRCGAEFLPEFEAASVGGVNSVGLISYAALLLIPVILDLKETISWNISRYRI